MEPIRVTQVLDAVKEQWYIDWLLKVGKREANRISRDAMKIGSRVDELIKTGRNPVPKDCEEVLMAMRAFRKWKEVYQPKSITPMRRMNMVVNGIEVTGEPDLLVDGTIVDIKCSKKINVKYWIQVNMYWAIAAFNNLEEVANSDIAILRLDKNTGAYEYQVKKFSTKLVEVWAGLMGYYIECRGDDDDRVEL